MPPPFICGTARLARGCRTSITTTNGQPRDVYRRIYWLWHAAYNGSGRACALIADYLRKAK